MKIQYCSDLHLEFPDNKEYILDNPLSPEADILILAGDIIPFAVLDKHNDFLDYISRNFKTTFWVPGNHEYYYYNVENSSVLDTKIREKTFSTRIVAAYPASACVPKGFTTACTIIIPMDTVDC